jgi:hypothetical protein
MYGIKPFNVLLLSGEEYAPNQQPSINAVRPPPIIPIIETRSKVEEIQKLDPNSLPETFLKQLSVALIANRGNKEILDRCLDALRSNNLNSAYFYPLEASTKKAHERPPLHGHHVENFPESSRIKLTRIEQLLKIHLKNDVAVHEEFERLIKVFIAQRHHSILDLALGSLG